MNEELLKNVDHPEHYKSGNFECIDVMEEVFGWKAVESFCICNAFKYLYRHEAKGGTEDLLKARWYLTYAISMTYPDAIPEGADALMKKKAELTAEVERLTEQVEAAREDLRRIKAEGIRY